MKQKDKVAGAVRGGLFGDQAAPGEGRLDAGGGPVAAVSRGDDHWMPGKCPGGAARFFFSSSRRHTSWTGDWSSDVCSSDLRRPAAAGGDRAGAGQQAGDPTRRRADDRKSVVYGNSVKLGGRAIMEKKKS